MDVDMRKAALAFIVLLFAALPLRAAELLMVDQVGCHYCERWTAEIGPIYPKTDESVIAPLRRVDIRAIPENLQLKNRPAFTPTFILLDGDREIARIEGYPGEDFFWGLLGKMLEKLPAQPKSES